MNFLQNFFEITRNLANTKTNRIAHRRCARKDFLDGVFLLTGRTRFAFWLLHVRDFECAFECVTTFRTAIIVERHY